MDYFGDNMETVTTPVKPIAFNPIRGTELKLIRGVLNSFEVHLKKSLSLHGDKCGFWHPYYSIEDLLAEFDHISSILVFCGLISSTVCRKQDRRPSFCYAEGDSLSRNIDFYSLHNSNTFGSPPKASATLLIESSVKEQFSHPNFTNSRTLGPQHIQSLHGSSRHALSEYGRFYNLSYASIAEQPGRRSTDLYRRNALHTPATSNSASHLQHFHIPQDVSVSETVTKMDEK
ncbi:hypothetical protein ACTXT7_006648 [Hymenolepis weldensis]